jgi:hypothetical protein
MNEQELAAIEARASKASNAPWIVVEAGDYSGANWLIGAVSVFLGASVWDDKSYCVTTKNVHASELKGDAKTDAEFIAHAREDVPALAAEVRQLKTQQTVALQLLGYCLEFFGDMPFEDYPPALDAKIRDFIRLTKSQAVAQ